MRPPSFRLEGPGLERATLVGFRGLEAIGRCFQVEIFVTTEDAGPVLGALGERLVLHFDGDEARELAGVVAEASILHELSGRALGRLVLVPRLWRLGLSEHSRLYTDASIPDVVRDVLARAGLSEGDDFELRLGGSYAVEAHVCQYHESDLAFVQRWLEHEGIHFFFEHRAGVDKLVLSDDSTAADRTPAAAVRYHPVGDDDASAGVSFARFSERRTSRAKEVALVDRDYARPDVDVSGRADAHPAGMGRLVSFGDDRFFDGARGRALARLRAEEELATQRSFRAEGVVPGLLPGFVFELVDHAVTRLDGAYLCVELEHHANVAATTPELRRLTGLGEGVYRAGVLAIPAATPFRPARLTPKPRVHGYLTAKVDGPADGDYAQLDADGRYRVKLHLDEGDRTNGKASTALRMQQPHVGNPEGMHFPLRKGTEVLVTCLDGDPDRPVIAGAIPNKVTPSVVTSKNHTHHLIHTGGDNVFDFEDHRSRRWIDVSSPTKHTFFHLGHPHRNRTHHVVLHTDGNALFSFGSNQDVSVGGKLEEIVEKDVEETYDAQQTSTVFGEQATTVTGLTKETYRSTQDTLTLGPVTETYDVDHDTLVASSPRKETFLSGQTTSVSGGGSAQSFLGPHMRVVNGPTVGTLASYTRHVTGSTTQLYAGPVTRIWGSNTARFKSLNLTIPGGVTEVHAIHQDNVPTHTVNHLVAHLTGPFKLEVASIYHGGSWLKVSQADIALSAVGAKMDTVGVGVALNGFRLEVNGNDLKPKWGPKFELAAFVIRV